MLEPGLFFFISLGAFYLFSSQSTQLQKCASRFAGYLLEYSFPSTSGNEHVKFGLLRIVFGYLLFNRSWQIQIAMLPSEYFTPEGCWSIASVALALFVTFGFLTQWSMLLLMFCVWHFGDRAMGVFSLANHIAGASLPIFFFSYAGKFLSIDQMLIARFKKLTPWLLYTSGIPSRETVALAKFASLFCYGMICIYSVCAHLEDAAWLSGVAGPYVLSNNFMSGSAGFFVDVFTHHKWAVDLANFALHWMMLWYPIIIIFVLMGGFCRAYVIYWGLAFFCLSSFILLIGSAAEFEFVLWAALFWAKTGLNSTPVNWLAARITPHQIQPSSPLNTLGIAVVGHIWLLSIFFFLAIPTFHLGITHYPYRINMAADFYGIGPTNVFNSHDVRMAENWFTLRDIKNGRLVPLLTAQGSRLALHRSDRVYFGHTLRFRRDLIDMKGCAFDTWKPSMDYLSRVYLNSINAENGTHRFEYTQYHQDLPDAEKVLGGEYMASPVTTPCTKTFDVEYAR